MSDINVTKVYEEDFGATVFFSDGHKAHFSGYAHGFGYSLEGLRKVFMWNGDEKKVFEYNSRLYRSGPSDGEHRIVILDAAYTQQDIAKYWKIARDYLHNNYFQRTRGSEKDSPELRKLWFPWRVICSEGNMDYSRLEKGEAKMLNEEKIEVVEAAEAVAEKPEAPAKSGERTVGDLISTMTSYPDVGLAMTIQEAIRFAIEKKGLKHESPLNATNLETIRQAIYDTNDPSRGNADPMLMFLNAMMSQMGSSHGPQGSGNTVEDSLQYIEKLIRAA